MPFGWLRSTSENADSPEMLMKVPLVAKPLHLRLSLPEPAYHHHRLILDAGGRKLSKSTLATSLRDLRAGGATPKDIRRLVGLAA